MNRRYAQHKYTWTGDYGAENHQWQMVCQRGGLHFTVGRIGDGEFWAGLEVHSLTPLYEDSAPSHSPCWLLGAPCWHDGTSSYALETLWPEIKAYLANGDHKSIFQVLECEANRRFYDARRPE